ncbi:MAG: hypothetical protein A3A58_00040 [Candidatus Blackburnbacteria bacterium RIFCSPLOWO2_01_FULL_41_27]|uniref:Uncharacterized protein n=2 Tax=Candidatus Blackburniibacteriota TaxID=1817898 RepID=A0A1G1VAP2_9BACT|nr:MAG: hypothetical protein A3F61_02475 [Candidatus Blackburnbacteria bacterium RIFCSPHIGHO2_12_FULL_41_13b]OGY14448.1 MAG: hypothetical protein A3A58_00040 [Candidatus Blackburnbacteria bacterium RIFCSPLOWO2_01_FULL_41_27]
MSERKGGVYSRRELMILAGNVIVLSCSGISREYERLPDNVMETEVGIWKIWGNRLNNGQIDYTSGRYTLEIPKRRLLMPRNYPWNTEFTFPPNSMDLYLQYANKNRLTIMGTIGNSRQSTQWSYWEDNPDYSQAFKLEAEWKDLVFTKVLWNNKPIGSR